MANNRSEISTKDCTWNKDTKTLSIEVSELEIITGGLAKRIMVQSHHTGKWMTFIIKETQRNQENEITGWLYINPEKTIKLQIWND